MKRLYIAEDLVEAQLLCTKLHAAGIEATVFNEFSNGALGELPFTHTWPEVWLVNKEDIFQALQIVDDVKQQSKDITESPCPKCGKSNPENFEICWNCACDL